MKNKLLLLIMFLVLIQAVSAANTFVIKNATQKHLTVDRSGIINVSGTMNLINTSLYQPVYGTDDDLVLYIPFNAPNGSIQFDRSPYGNDGVQNGSVCNATNGKYGAGCEFDGVDDYVDLPDISEMNTEYTVELWAKTTKAIADITSPNTYWGGIYASGHHKLEAEHSADIIRFYWYNGSAYQDIRYSVPGGSNKWHHIVIWWSRSDGSKLYVDGILRDSNTVSSSTSSLTNQYIGADTNKGNNFNGTIDEVKIYKRALTPEEIRTHYLRGKGYGASGAITADKFRIVNTSGSKIFEVNQSGVKIAPGGVDRLTIDSSGYVGIGTTSPTTKLDVAGTINTTAIKTSTLNVSGTSYLSIINGTLGWGNLSGVPSGLDDGDDVGILNNTQAQLSDLNVTGTLNVTGQGYFAGNVGIGTITPQQKLHINGTVLINSSNAAGALNVINASGSSMLFVNGSTGRVGIGTSSPAHRLHAAGAGDTSTDMVITDTDHVGLELRSSGTGKVMYIDFTDISTDDSGSGTPDYRGRIIYAGSTDIMSFHTGNDTTAKMVIDPNGNVGIGTTTPNKELVVNGTSNALVFAPSETMPTINTTGTTNMTITSSGGSVIIRLG